MNASFIAVAMLSLSDPIPVEWDAPESCPQEPDVRQMIEGLVKENASGDVQATGMASQEGDVWKAVVMLERADDAAERRELTGPTCQSVAEAYALIVAIALFPGLLFGDAEPDEGIPGREAEGGSGAAAKAAPVSEPQPSQTESPTVDDSLARPPRTATRGPSLFVQTTGGVGFGGSPGFAAQINASFGVRLGAFRLEAMADFWSPTPVTSPENPSTGGVIWGVSGGLAGCGVPAAGNVAFPLCVAARAGGLVGTGTGNLDPRRAAKPWVTVGAEAGLVWPRRGPVGLALRVGGGPTLLRPSFVTEPSGRVYVAPAGFFMVGLGIQVRFLGKPVAKRVRSGQ